MEPTIPAPFPQYPRIWRITPEHPLWPRQLADLGHDAPVELFGIGNVRGLHSLQQPSDVVAITGSRASSDYGNAVSAELTKGLVNDHGKTIVTGGSYGIDASALRAAIDAGGIPVAMMAGGLDQLYPIGNRGLLEQVAGRGLLLSEQPVGSPPKRERFLRRNLLVAALAGCTVVVEAGPRSGAVDMARKATGLGRAVAAVPGPITSAASVGSNQLIKDGVARLVDGAGAVAGLAQGLDRVPSAPMG